MKEENLEELLKEIVSIDKEIKSKIHDLKTFMIKKNTGGKEYIV